MDRYFPGKGLDLTGSKITDLLDPKQVEQLRFSGGVVLLSPVKVIQAVMGDGERLFFMHEYEIPKGGKVLRDDGTCYDPHHIGCIETRGYLKDIHARLGLERH